MIWLELLMQPSHSVSLNTVKVGAAWLVRPANCVLVGQDRPSVEEVTRTSLSPSMNASQS